MMEKSVKNNFAVFLVKLFFYSFLIYAALLLIRNSIPPKFYYEHSAYLIVFFFFVTAVFHFGALRNAAKGGRSIVSYFMLATAVKFFLYLMVMIGYALLNPGKATAFISTFFLIYVLLTIFEVSVIYTHFKSKPENRVKVNP